MTMKKSVFTIVVLSLVTSLIAGCAPSVTPVPTLTPVPPTSIPLPPMGAFESNEYRNLFKEYLGKSDEEVQAKLDAAWERAKAYPEPDPEEVKAYAQYRAQLRQELGLE